ncbi:hypothetical protein RHS03_06156, partial [Rhizoctonia solani]
MVNPLATQWVYELFDTLEHPITSLSGTISNDTSSSMEVDTIDELISSELLGEEGSSQEDILLATKGLSRSEVTHRYLFSNLGEVFTTAQVSNCLREITARHLGKPYGVAALRHILIAIIEDVLGLKPYHTDSQMSETIPDSWAAHSAWTRAARYTVNDDDRTLFSYNSISKYIDASVRLHDWIEGKVPLALEEICPSSEKELIAEVANLRAELVKQKTESDAKLEEMHNDLKGILKLMEKHVDRA